MHLLACWSFLAAVTADSGCIGYVEKPANVQLKFKLKGPNMPILLYSIDKMLITALNS